MGEKYKMEGIEIPSWETINSYFTTIDQQHMLAQTNGELDLKNCASNRANAEAIYGMVSSGNMPPGNPWASAWINNYYTWWKEGDCS